MQARPLALGLSLLAVQAAAQVGDLDGGALPVAPRTAETGESAPTLQRESGLAVELGDSNATPDAGVTEAEVPAPAPVATPSTFAVSASIKASVRASYQGATEFPLDSTLDPLTVAPLLTRVRASPEVHLGGFGLIAEADTATGAILGTPSATLVGTRVPYPPISPLELRKLYLEYKWASGAFRVGQQTMNWGLGLLANDGAKDPEAGDFGQQHFGNLSYRALLAVRPFYNWGGRWKAFETAFAADLVVRDNFGEFAKDDRAFQGVLAVRFAKDTENQFGVYAVYRNQRNIAVTDGGKATDVVVVNLAGKWEFLKRRDRELKLGLEAVTINGTTTQARSDNAALLGVHQFGAAAKGAFRIRQTTLLLDWGYASGDQNPGDDQIQNFRFDRDFKVGLVLFEQVMAYQSARAGVRASDPNLVGVAPEGADLLGTAGSVTGAWYIFPRVKQAIRPWLDVYGGPLFAFGTARLADPFNSRIGGGQAVNSLGGRPGLYMGTEIDVGLQARFHPVEELLLSVTGEGGLFLPGDAFRLPAGGLMAPVGFGRVRLTVAL
ncbi:MAG: hypothetical protein JNG84_12690 [Archangium sp.]|nr:hypothetical protein [Archangium sp.]